MSEKYLCLYMEKCKFKYTCKLCNINDYTMTIPTKSIEKCAEFEEKDYKENEVKNDR